MIETTPATGVWFFPDRPAKELVEAIVHAESVGLDEVWLGDEGPAREPFTILAAAATATSRITLAVGITNPYVRHPAVAVASIATIAELSGGRAVLGVGAGGAMSLTPFGLAALTPVSAVERFLQIAEASREGFPVDGYAPSDIAVAAVAPRVPTFVGGRGPRLNRLASASADGAFVAGMPPFRYDDVIGWARSVQPIDIALYPSVAFDEAARERHRPEMIWSLLDASDAVCSQLGVDPERVQSAAVAVRAGNPEPARALIDDQLLEQLMLLGDPKIVGQRLAALVTTYRPSSIGLAIIADDLLAAIDNAQQAFEHMTRELEAT